MKMVIDKGRSERLFKEFIQADSFTSITESFRQLCDSLDINTREYDTVYEKLKDQVRSDVAVNLWQLLDRRAQQEVYGDGNICTRQKIFVIGAGPCGLRMAIEARFLGSQVVVVEMRNYVTRNNVLHLWPSVIHDLKSIGAKIFYRQFCTGSLDHISIRKLQNILLKTALVLGVEIHAPVRFLGLREPTDSRKGWTAQLEPVDHPASNYEFDFIVGADGKRNSLNGFKRKCFRAKQAIAVTFNLVNNKTNADNQVEEIPGLFYIFAQDFFNNLKEKADIDLENIVYFRDETHYFVMTAKKSSLLKRRVLKEDMRDTQSLLSWDNINREEILHYARDAAEIATNYQMPKREFAKDHCGQDDVAIFDFTAMFHCEYSTLIRERFGHNLVMTIVGDGLIEPFWPTGSGAGRGFLSVQDSAWLLRMRGLGRDPLQCLAEKETLFQMLQQASPSNLKKKYNEVSIDPATRYLGKTEKVYLLPDQVKHLYITHDQVMEEIPDIIPKKQPTPKPQRKKPTKRSQSSDTATLLTWYQDKLSSFKNSFPIQNLDSCWRDGRALCALASLHRPNLVDMEIIEAQNAHENIQLALDIFHREFGLEALVTPDDIVNETGDKTINQLALLSYLGQLQELLIKDPIREHQEESSEPPAKKLQEAPPASVLLMRLNSKEPELMGMSIGAKALEHIAKAKTKVPKTVESPTDSGQVSSSSPHARFGEVHPESEEEIRACSGIALKRIQAAESRTHGKFVQYMGMPQKETEQIATVPIRGSTQEAPKPSGESRGASCWDRSSVMGDNGAKLTLDSFTKQLNKTSKKEQQRSSSSEYCFICGKQLYFIERTYANGFCIHRECLRCCVCNCTLRQGNSHVYKPEGEKLAKFYCFRHFHEAGHFVTSNVQKKQQRSDPPRQDLPDFTPTTAVTEEQETEKHEESAPASEKEIAGTEMTDEPEDEEEPPNVDSASDQETEVRLRQKQADRPADRPDSEYRESASMRLLMAQEIQDGLEEVDTEEKELEERGKQVEETIKNHRPGTPVEETEIMDEWMSMMKKKQDLKEKESKLMLQMKLLQLQERQKDLLKDMKLQMEGFRGSVEMEQALEQLDRDTSSLEANMTAIKDQIKNLKLYLGKNES